MSVASVGFSRFLLVASLSGAAVFGVAANASAQAKPGYTAAQAERGQKLFGDNCAMCHGGNLDDGEFAPGLKGQAFGDYWKGKTASDVLTYINTMMPPTQPGMLGPQGSADVLAFILKSGGAPAGDKELPTDPAALGKAPVYP